LNFKSVLFPKKQGIKKEPSTRGDLSGKGLKSLKIEELQLSFFHFQTFKEVCLNFKKCSGFKKQGLKKERGDCREKGLESLKIEELQLPVFNFQVGKEVSLNFKSVLVPKNKLELIL
jgi:hypothetical protein